MSTDQHDAIYDILIRECGAIESNRELFRRIDLAVTSQRVRFGGQLGLDGVFGVDREGCWFVAFDPQDATPKREAMCARANAALNELQGA